MKFLKKIIFFLMTLAICISLLYFVCYILPPIKMDRSNEITIYDRNNNIILQTQNDIEGNYILLDNINEDFIIAFIASEDETFYNHIGFSFKGIIRALYSNVVNDTKQGGSTISQQLSRTLFLDNEKSLARKIKEALITIRIETHYDKSKIIEEYLNNIYLGHNIYGIENASKYYFNKSNTDLTLDEVCLIVGIANAPNINAPDINYQNAINRKNYVLERLYKIKAIDYKTFDYNIKKETIMNYNKNTFSSIFTPLFYYTKNFLLSNNLLEKNYLSNGLKVYTTIDKNIQEILYSKIIENNPNDGSEISSVILKSNSNDVLAIVGGYNCFEQYNRALQAIRPIGSTIKPLLYYLALKCGMEPTTLLTCKQMTFNIKGYGSYSPTNASNKYANNKINMIEAIGLSDNIYATKTLLFVGLNNFNKLLSKFNIKTNCVPSSALGVDEMSLINLTSIYNCFASLGTYYIPIIIDKICLYNNKCIYKSEKRNTSILEKPYVFVLNQLLRAPFDKNLIDYTTPTLLNYQTNHLFAAKTGSDKYNSYVVGFNPNFTIGVWSGSDNNVELNYKNISKKVFKETVNEISNENVWYNPPSYIDVLKIDPITMINSLDGSEYWKLHKIFD